MYIQFISVYIVAENFLSSAIIKFDKSAGKLQSVNIICRKLQREARSNVGISKESCGNCDSTIKYNESILVVSDAERMTEAVETARCC